LSIELEDVAKLDQGAVDVTLSDKLQRVLEMAFRALLRRIAGGKKERRRKGDRDQ